jgi:hypothetical protein
MHRERIKSMRTLYGLEGKLATTEKTIEPSPEVLSATKKAPEAQQQLNTNPPSQPLPANDTQLPSLAPTAAPVPLLDMPLDPHPPLNPPLETKEPEAEPDWEAEADELVKWTSQLGASGDDWLDG